jgi:S-adenosyl-L-methionine hydrolase (adenosine-forming)
VTARMASPWRPSGVVTLLTDFGTVDPYVGILKGVLLARFPGARPVDLTHGVTPQDIRGAAFFLARSWSWFPAGSVHVAVVDPGVGSARRILVALEGGHAFLAPDNGLLGPVLSEKADVRALDVERFALPERSRTFHGRDVFAPAAAAIAAGLDPRDAGGAAGAWERLRLPSAARGPDGALRGEVLFADAFGNLVTNLEAARGPAGPSRPGGAAGTLEIAGRRLPVVGTYADAPSGELLALVDSYGFLEVAVRGGSAARALGVGAGAPVVYREDA